MLKREQYFFEKVGHPHFFVFLTVVIVVTEKLLSFVQDALQEYSIESGASGESAVFLVDMLVKGGNRARNVEIFVDTEKGISMTECMRAARWLRSALDENPESRELLDDDYELTVSSPGIGKPIRHERQYIRHLGRILRVQYIDDDDAVHEVTGRLLQAELHQAKSPFLVLEPLQAGRKKKHAPLETIRLELGRIKRAVVEVEF